MSSIRRLPRFRCIPINDNKVYDGTSLVFSYTRATAISLMTGDKLTAGAIGRRYRRHLLKKINS